VPLIGLVDLEDDAAGGAAEPALHLVDAH